MIASSGCVAVVDMDLCAACGTCADFCQFVAISVGVKTAEERLRRPLPAGGHIAAISLLRDLTKGEPLEIQRLIAEAAATGLT